MGFTQVSVSHEVSPMMKLVSRGDTTVVDAYLSPILRRYVDRVATQMPGVRLFFMQSSGGLAEAHHFQGKDAILSGPAGGIGLAEPGAHHQRELHAEPGRLRHRLERGIAGDRHDYHVGHLGQALQAGPGPQPLGQFASRVDRIDAPLVAEALQVDEGSPADLVGLL